MEYGQQLAKYLLKTSARSDQYHLITESLADWRESAN